MQLRSTPTKPQSMPPACNCSTPTFLAPINARAGSLMINLGNLVKANDTPYLVQLNQVTPIYVTFSSAARPICSVCGSASRRRPAQGARLIPSGKLNRPVDAAVDLHRQWRGHEHRHVQAEGHALRIRIDACGLESS